MAKQSKFLQETADAKTFEETYKTAYSHGLEAIYALENIDIRSIRKIQPIPVEILPKKNFSSRKYLLNQPQQLEIDFGRPFRRWIEPFFLEEPIEVLSLTRHAENCLKEHEIGTIGLLSNTNLNDFIYFKGMGQGHIDEIRQKLDQYLEGKPFKQSFFVDFAGWIRSIAGSVDRKKIYVLMEEHALESLFTLSPSENTEVKRLTLEKKREWIEEAMKALSQPSIRQKVVKGMRRVVDAFIRPWMVHRQGLATTQDLLEWTLRIDEYPEIAAAALSFLSVMFFDGSLPYSPFLECLEEDLFCATFEQSEWYHQILDKALTYFINPEAYYQLEELSGWIEKEFAKRWHGFPDGFVRKVLKSSSKLRVRKGLKGLQEVRLALHVGR